MKSSALWRSPDAPSRQIAGSSRQKTKDRGRKTEGFLSVVRGPWSVVNKSQSIKQEVDSSERKLVNRYRARNISNSEIPYFLNPSIPNPKFEIRNIRAMRSAFSFFALNGAYPLLLW